MKSQVDILADWILANFLGEPSRSEGAVDCAIRIMQQQRATIQQQADKIAELESTMTCMYEGHRQQIEDADTKIFLAQQQIQQLEALNKGLDAELEMYRSIAEKIGAETAVSQLSQAQAKVQQLEARVKESEEISSWYRSLVKRACIGSKETPSLKAYIEQLEARIVSLETEVDMNAWRTSPAMAQATIDQLVTRNEQIEAELREWRNGNGGIVKLHLDSSPDSA